MHHWQIQVPAYAIWTKDVPRHLSDMQMDQVTEDLPGIIAIHEYISMHIYSCTPRGAWLTPPPADADSQRAWYCLQQHQSAGSGSLKLPSMVLVLCSQHKAYSWIPPKSKPPKTFLLQIPKVTLQSFLGLINYLQPLYPWSFHKNNVLVWTTCQVGLEPLNRCTLPTPQSLDLPDPSQCNPCILWQI